MDRTDTLIVKKDGRQLASSAIILMSREAGCYAQLSLSKTENLNFDDILEIYHKADGTETKIATLSVYAIPITDSKIEAWATDPYREKLKAMVQPAGWRHATVKEIVEDVLFACNVASYDLSELPSVKLPHFSYKFQSGWSILQNLIYAVRDYNGRVLTAMPDVNGKLLMGNYKDIAPAAPSFSVSLRDVVLLGEKYFSLHLLPLLCYQSFDYEGNSYMVKAATHSVSASMRESQIWTF